MLGVFFVAGLALSLTPCVLPMVPILSSIIAGQGGTVSTSRGFFLSLSYVLGMAATYTAAGALAALAGGQVQAMFQKPWIISLFAGMFFVLALGMFGLFELQMPTAIQTRLSQLADKQKGGTFLGVGDHGRAHGADRDDLRRAAAHRSAHGDRANGRRRARGERAVRDEHGHGRAAAARRRLGRATAAARRPVDEHRQGRVRRDDGRHRDLDDGARAAGLRHARALGVLVFLTGVFLGAFENLPENPRPVRRLAKGLGVLACIYGALMLIGATLGGENPLQPIPRGSFASASTAARSAPRRSRSWSSARSKRSPRSTPRSPKLAARANR